MKARAARFLSETPVVFIGIVLTIAIVFRLGIGAVKPAAAEPEAYIPPRAPAAIHTPIASAKPAAPTVQAEPAPAVAVASPEPSTRAPGAIPKKKPRTHGKR
jgi:hypothetical protein